MKVKKIHLYKLFSQFFIKKYLGISLFIKPKKIKKQKREVQLFKFKKIRKSPYTNSKINIVNTKTLSVLMLMILFAKTKRTKLNLKSKNSVNA